MPDRACNIYFFILPLQGAVTTFCNVRPNGPRFEQQHEWIQIVHIAIVCPEWHNKVVETVAGMIRRQNDRLVAPAVVVRLTMRLVLAFLKKNLVFLCVVFITGLKGNNF